jgi:hypothetical protein
MRSIFVTPAGGKFADALSYQCVNLFNYCFRPRSAIGI